MLKRPYRLRKDKDFQKLYRHGKRYFTTHLGLYFLYSKAENSQVGLVVSKKVSKKAVVRNRLRRRLSASLEQKLPEIKQTYMAVIVVRRDFSDLKPSDLNQEVNQLTKRLQ